LREIDQPMVLKYRSVPHVTRRIGISADVDELRVLMNAAIGALQTPFLRADQIESSQTIMGLE
jgi:hypothetical protein